MRSILLVIPFLLFHLLGQSQDTCSVCGKQPVKNWSANYAQSLQPLLSIADTSANTVQLDLDFHQNSNSINTVFAGAFLSKNNISPAMKNRVLQFAGDRILYEDELKTGLAYRHFFKKQKLSIYASYYHRNMRQLNAGRDAFRLVFGGNKYFEDKTVDLSQTHFQNLMYNQYAVGLSGTVSNWNLGVNFSFLQGFSNQQLRTNKASLYTAPQGEYLDATYQYEFRQSNTGASHYFDGNGYGFSGDVHIQYKTERGQWSFDANDIGFIYWQKSPTSYRGDSAIRFEGLVIDDITKIGQGLSVDSLLKNFLPRTSHSGYSILLPFQLQLVYSKPVALKNNNAMVVNLGINTRNIYKYYAYGYVKLNFILQKKWLISTSAGYGGYSNFNIGFEVAKKSKWVDVALGTTNLIGDLVPMYYPGSSVYLRAMAKF